MGDHEDYLPGEAPAAHHESHEDLGSDEINVGGLIGELADDQPCIAHDLGGAKHVADSLADLNTKVSDATLDDSGDPRTPSAHKLSHQDGGTDEISVAGLAGETAGLAAHKILPTVHQDAPGLIETHRLVAGAHHAKYTDAEARAVHSPISIPTCSFLPYLDTHDWESSDIWLKNRSSLLAQYFLAPIIFPNGVTVTKLTLFGYRDLAAAVMSLDMTRLNRAVGQNTMSAITADWISGYSSKYDATIATPVIDNNNYDYHLTLLLNPSASVNEIKFTGAKIEFTG